MKSILSKTTSLVVVLAVGFSCAKDSEIEKSTSDVAMTRSLSEINTDVDYYYLGSEKVYFNIRRDKMIVKTSSNLDAEKLSKNDIFTDDQQSFSVGEWVVGSINMESKLNIATDKEIGLALKSYGATDAAYGLESAGLIRYPTDQIAVRCNDGESPENILAKVGLAENIEAIDLIIPIFNVYLITLNVDLDDILRTSREMYETGMCVYAEPCFIKDIKFANEFYPLQWG